MLKPRVAVTIQQTANEKGFLQLNGVPAPPEQTLQALPISAVLQTCNWGKPTQTPSVVTCAQVVLALAQVIPIGTI